MSIEHMKRQRNTSSVQRRVENMLNLLAEFKVRAMASDEIAEFLGFSASGTRKYVKDLRDCFVIEFDRYEGAVGNYIGWPVWRISNNIEAHKAFIESLSAPPCRRGPAIKKESPSSSDPTRHFHVMKDDIHYAIRLNREPVRRDSLVAALFGAAPPQPESK